MSVYRISGGNLKKIEDLYKNWDETLIWSCLQGCMGTAWVDNDTNPKSAQIVIGDFCFFAGMVNEELVKNKPPRHQSDSVIMVPQNEEWERLIEKVYGEKAVRATRYAIKKEPDIFDINKLEQIVANVGRDYEIKLIDEELYKTVMENKWSSDFCSQFESFEQYHKRGLGVVVLHQGELVSGASSYTVYRGGIEIEIDTREDYRRKGLALACGARLILECLNRKLYPSWDAQNKWSVALAEKLGYHFDKEYPVYGVNGYGAKSLRGPETKNNL